MVTKATFVGEGFTRKPVKMERFVRPMALRYKKANVTHRKSRYLVVYQTGTRPSCSGLEGNFPASNSWGQEESTVADVHSTRSFDKGHCHRG